MHVNQALRGLLAAMLACCLLIATRAVESAEAPRILAAAKGTGQAASAKRVALVIGNANYQGLPPLGSPVNDAYAIASALKELGFDVSTGVNLSRPKFGALLRNFADSSRSADISLFYYSGHAYAVEGRNYIVPIDADMSDELRASYEGIPIEEIQAVVESTSNTRMMLFDACNDSPFRPRFKGLPRGLAPMAPRGANTFIAFAAAPGTLAYDGSSASPHSPFTQAVLEELRQPRGDVQEMFARVGRRVQQLTAGRQQTYTTSTLLSELFLGTPRPQAPLAPADGLPTADAADIEVLLSADTRVNGESIAFLGDERKSVMQLEREGLLRMGLNTVVAKGKEYRMWYESKKLERFAEPYSNSYAVIAAIGAYGGKGRDKKFPDLGFMVEGARQLSERLEKMGFPRDHIKFLPDEQATAENFEHQLRAFWKGGEFESADRLVIYFGGHGTSVALDSDEGDAPEKKGILVMSNYRSNEPTRTGFLLDDLKRHLQYIRARHVLVLIDACSSGLALPKHQDEPNVDAMKSFNRLATIRADVSKRARDIFVAGTGDERALWINGGIFTKALIRALSGAADWNKDGLLQFEEVALQVKNEVTARAAETGFKQVPNSLTIGDGRFLFVLPLTATRR